MARIRAFCAWREPAPTAADVRPGRKCGDWAARLSVCLFGTTLWLTRLPISRTSFNPWVTVGGHESGRAVRLRRAEHAGPKDFSVPAVAFSADDRGTRIADVVIAWNVFRHFYPYFDIGKTDWDAVLPVALRAAAAAKDGAEFLTTLLKMVAALKDGHGRVTYSAMKPQGHGSGRGGVDREQIHRDLVLNRRS